MRRIGWGRLTAYAGVCTVSAVLGLAVDWAVYGESRELGVGTAAMIGSVLIGVFLLTFVWPRRGRRRRSAASSSAAVPDKTTQGG